MPAPSVVASAAAGSRTGRVPTRVPAVVLSAVAAFVVVPLKVAPLVVVPLIVLLLLRPGR